MNLEQQSDPQHYSNFQFEQTSLQEDLNLKNQIKEKVRNRSHQSMNFEIQKNVKLPPLRNVRKLQYLQTSDFALHHSQNLSERNQTEKQKNEYMLNKNASEEELKTKNLLNPPIKQQFFEQMERIEEKTYEEQLQSHQKRKNRAITKENQVNNPFLGFQQFYNRGTKDTFERLKKLQKAILGYQCKQYHKRTFFDSYRVLYLSGDMKYLVVGKNEFEIDNLIEIRKIKEIISERDVGQNIITNEKVFWIIVKEQNMGFELVSKEGVDVMVESLRGIKQI